MVRGRRPKVCNEEVCGVVSLFKTRVFENGKIVPPTNSVFIEMSNSLNARMTPKAIYLFIRNNKCAQSMYNEWGLQRVLEEEDQQMKHQRHLLPKTKPCDLPLVITLNEVTYTLRGFLGFCGKTSSITSIGHYVAYVRRCNDTWELYDDTKDSKICVSPSKSVPCQVLVYTV
ncbi:uncharacterized protein LOC120349843 [Nilaparvata lugens]|uniref:uncharacterized protein LOC120349843 n=1 Tax=Nilaparvata lugens TaxID=108931 RepID=UPI00193E9545|nr:uncharacterized protein LOC120349843 [Nilaparvata lugens]